MNETEDLRREFNALGRNLERLISGMRAGLIGMRAADAEAWRRFWLTMSEGLNFIEATSAPIDSTCEHCGKLADVIFDTATADGGVKYCGVHFIAATFDEVITDLLKIHGLLTDTPQPLIATTELWNCETTEDVIERLAPFDPLAELDNH